MIRRSAWRQCWLSKMSRHPWLNLLMRWLIIAVGVALSAWIVPGITYDDAVTLLVVVALLSLFNAILKPLLVIFTLPFVVLSLGLGIWIINALLFLAVSRLVQGSMCVISGPPCGAR